VGKVGFAAHDDDDVCWHGLVVLRKADKSAVRTINRRLRFFEPAMGDVSSIVDTFK
jgi:hypothetical protein